MGGTGERILVSSLDEGMEKLRSFADTKQSFAFALLMEQEETLAVYTRKDQPCYGELRPYGPESTQPEVIKPSDLCCPFPNGTPLAVSVPAYRKYQKNREPDESSIDVLNATVDPEVSPWRSILEGVITTDKHGLVFPDASIDPTVLVSFLRFRTSSISSLVIGESFREFRETVGYDDALYLTCMFRVMTPANVMWSNANAASTWLSPSALRSGTILKPSGGTLSERYAYDRPGIMNIWGSEGEHIVEYLKGYFEATLIPNKPEEIIKALDELNYPAKGD